MVGSFLVSVIVPIFNAESYLNECVDSILAQSYSHFEVILVDDGSTDSSGMICDQYAQKDCRVRVLHQKNAGVSAARNAGIDCSSGEYIAFVDSDDWLDSNFLEYAIRICKQNKCDVFMSGIARVHNGKQIRFGKITKEIFTQDTLQEMDYIMLLDNCYTSSCCASLYKRSCVGVTRFDSNSIWGEDLSFVHELLEKKPSIFATPQIFYNYRLTDGSATMRFEINKGMSVQNAYLKLYSFADSMGYHENGEYIRYVDKRLVDDYLMLYNIIFFTYDSFSEQYLRIRSLLSNEQIRNRLRKQRIEPYFRKYGSRTILAMAYNAYKQRKNNKEKLAEHPL